MFSLKWKKKPSLTGVFYQQKPAQFACLVLSRWGHLFVVKEPLGEQSVPDQPIFLSQETTMLLAFLKVPRIRGEVELEGGLIHKFSLSSVISAKQRIKVHRQGSAGSPGCHNLIKIKLFVCLFAILNTTCVYTSSENLTPKSVSGICPYKPDRIRFAVFRTNPFAGTVAYAIFPNPIPGHP